MATLVLDQYAPGGPFKQISDAAGGSAVVYSQYAPGGAAEQLRQVIDPGLVWDQYAPGGCAGQAVVEVDEGGSAPEWVPADAVIHIDLLGGTPQGRAWVDGTGEVAVDTLLGSDPNTEEGWDVTVYDPAFLTSDGYNKTTLPTSFAFIGEARTRITSGATFSYQTKLLVVAPDNANEDMLLLSADGNFAVEFNAVVGGAEMNGSSWNGSFNVTSDSGPMNVAQNAINKTSYTLTSTRAEAAANGVLFCDAALDETDWPTSGAGEIVAALIDVGGGTAVQSITIYDPLPDTTGLSGLSEA